MKDWEDFLVPLILVVFTKYCFKVLLIEFISTEN